MFCTNCGKLHPDGANFCPHCGSPIGENEWEEPVIPEAYVAPLSPLSPDFEPEEELDLDEDLDLDLDLEIDLDPEAEGFDPEPAPAAERPEPVYEPAPAYDAPAPSHGYTVPGSGYTVPGGAYAPVGGNAPAAPAAPYIPADAPPRKKKTGLVVCLILVAVLVVAVAGMVGAFSMVEDSDYDDYAYYYDGDSDKIALKEGETASNAGGKAADKSAAAGLGDYEEILAEFAVADESVLEEDFGYDKVDCYAMVDADGGLSRMELAYTMLDVVQAMAETYYYPIETFTDEELDMFVQVVQDELDVYEDMDFITVEGEVTNDYYILTMVIDGLDDTDIMDQATEAGFLTEEGALYVSKSASEDDYLAAGYVKR